MSLTFKNTGKSPLYRVRAVASSTNPRLNFQELLFGYVRPGKQVTKRFAVKIPKGVSARSDNITFKFYSALKPLPVAARGKVVIKGSRLPQLALSYAFHDTRNSDGMLEPGEVGEFHVTVKNVGDGPTGEAKVMLKNLTGSEVSIEKSRADISNLKPGASISAVFKVRALRLSGDKFWKFKLETTDCNYGNNVEIPWYVRRATLKRTMKLSQRGSVVIKRDTVLFDTPWRKSQKPQRLLKKASVVPVAFLINKHYAVPTTTKGYYLFVPKGVVTKSPKGATPVARASFNHTSPDIFLAEPALQVTNGRVLISGKVSDSDGIRDFYITVTNLKRRVYASKVHYQSPKGAKKHSFKVNVPLTRGVNIITVTARDTRRASYSRNVVVYSSR